MQGANDVISRLHAALGIVLFRPFTEDRRPGGRYWFRAANPFVRLDVSFYEPAEFDDPDEMKPAMAASKMTTIVDFDSVRIFCFIRSRATGTRTKL